MTIPNVGVNPTRTGILDVLTQMGADIELMDTREQAGEPVADLRVRAGKLHGVRVGREQIPRTIDEFPILCVAAALADGETVISGAEELRVKRATVLPRWPQNSKNSVLPFKKLRTAS